MFFIISGYLISSIIYKKADSESFSFKDFYSRRIRRIWPALVTVLSVCFVAGYFLFIPKDFYGLGGHMLFANLFSLNFKLMTEGGYFDVDTSLKPLMHLWSLSVEEQFYLVAPFVVVWLWKKRTVMEVFASLAIFASLEYSILSSSSVGYLNPLTRIWEMGLGCVVGYIHFRGFSLEHTTEEGEENFFRSRRSLLKNAASVVAVLLIMGSNFLLSEDSPFPSWRALFPCAGAAILIGYTEESWFNSKVLTFSVMVWIGLISYPLYLWHFPFLAGWKVITGLPVGLLSGLCLQAAAFACAAATYYLIEKPLRFGKRIALIILCLVGLSIVLAILGALAMFQVIGPFCTTDPVLDTVLARDDFQDWGYEFQHFMRWKYPGYITPFDLFRADGHDPGDRVMFFGDSNCIQYLSGVDEHLGLFPSQSRDVVFWTYPDNFPGLGYVSPAFPTKDFVKVAFKYAAEDANVTHVVIAALWYHYFSLGTELIMVNPETWTQIPIYTAEQAHDILMASFKHTLDTFQALGKKITVILTIPQVEAFDPEKMVKRRGLRIVLDVKNAEKKEIPLGMIKLHEEMKLVIKEYGANVIDPSDFIFGNLTSVSPLQPSYRPLYFDKHHISSSYARQNVKSVRNLILKKV